jgi:pyridine nucleotide-disulfide oxidoreductase family protein
MKRLVLLGGGHAHVHVLDAMAHEPWPGVEAVLVTPHARQMYSGMVPGVVAGHYRPEEAAIPLAPLARAAGVSVRWTSAQGVDAAAREVRLSDGSTLGYDVLSIDTGAVMDRDAIAGAREHALFVRPIEDFVEAVPGLVSRVRPPADGPPHVVVVGGGAAGFEIALALAHAHGARMRLALVTGGGRLLQGYPESVIRRGERAAARLGVEVCQAAVAAIGPGAVRLQQDGRQIRCDQAVVAIGASAAPWLKGSGLTLDERGFVTVGPTLQSLSHPDVFAAGDVASRLDVHHPRSGVYAVRAGPPLARNLRRMLQGEEPQPYAPQARTLNLLSCGGRQAIAAWGGLCTEGAWVWRWKDRIDRAFIRRFSRAQSA